MRTRRLLAPPFVVVTAVAAAVTGGCAEPMTSNPPAPSANPPPPSMNPPAPEPPMAKSALARNTQPSVPQADANALEDGNTAFAADFYKTVAGAAESQGQNLFFSPHSISIALAMTYAGAHGATATQMATALHYTLPADRLAQAFDALDLALTAPPKESGDFTLRVANSLWGAPQTTFVPAFLDTLATDYGAGIRLTDFAANPSAATKAINQWVSDETEDKIPNVLPDGVIDPATRFVLVNAVYFKARWALPFESTQTRPGTFHAAAGDVPASMMHEAGELQYGEAPDQSWAAASLPYLGGCSMVVVVPKNLAAFESTLSRDTVAAVTSSLGIAEVNLTLPKFEIKGASVSLTEALRARGMTDAFDAGAADFSGIASSDRLYLQDVRHQAFVAVDEEGTEAAAATAVVGGTTSAPTKQATLTVDRPFVFFIREPKTGAILFLGRVLHV